MTSIPSANFTPWISFGNWLWPSNRSQSPWNRPIWGAAREFDFRDNLAARGILQKMKCCCLREFLFQTAKVYSTKLWCIYDAASLRWPRLEVFLIALTFVWLI